MSHTIEYQIRPVTRYVVTRFESQSEGEGHPGLAASAGMGEFPNYDMAEVVAKALVDSDPHKIATFISPPPNGTVYAPHS